MDTLARTLVGFLFSFVLLTTSHADEWKTLLPGSAQVGQGQFSRFGWSIYQAQLWALDGKYDPGQPFALRLTYERDIPESRIVQASLDEMAKLGAPVQQRPGWRAILEQVIDDVKKGESITGVYRPGEGATFFHNDKLTGVMDEELARAFFAIWLDARTSEPALRQALLGPTGR